jgi:hypothetical protein
MIEGIINAITSRAKYLAPNLCFNAKPISNATATIVMIDENVKNGQFVNIVA